jgi:hypothetical protein
MESHAGRPGGTGTQYLGTMPIDYSPYIQAAGTFDRRLVELVQAGEGSCAVSELPSDYEGRIQALNQRFFRRQLARRLVAKDGRLWLELSTSSTHSPAGDSCAATTDPTIRPRSKGARPEKQ